MRFSYAHLAHDHGFVHISLGGDVSDEQDKPEEKAITVRQAPQEVAVRPAAPNYAAMALVPTNIAEAVSTAKLLAASGMFKHKSAETAFAALMIGRELGLPPAASMRAIDIIDGKPAPSSDALVAACLRRPDVCEYMYCVDEDDEHSTWATKRVGAPTERRITFTMKEAATAGLTKKEPWKFYPRRMMGHRAAAFLAREVYPDVVMGMYSEDEQRDMAPEVAPMSAVRAYDEGSEAILDLIEELNTVGTSGGPGADQLALMVSQAEAQVPTGSTYRLRVAQAIKQARSRVQHLERTGQTIDAEVVT
jgi:hypothetical protein